jgi:hypothetical protein
MAVRSLSTQVSKHHAAQKVGSVSVTPYSPGAKKMAR